jgi:hypothetical protein
MTLLLSGRITSDMKNYKKRFEHYENILQSLGYTIINPAKNTFPLNVKNMTKKQIWNYFMRISLSQLMMSDGIYLMPFWWLSKGARFEAFTAWRLDIPRIKIQISERRAA